MATDVEEGSLDYGESAAKVAVDSEYRELFDKIFGYPAGHDMTLEAVKQWVTEWIDDQLAKEMKP